MRTTSSKRRLPGSHPAARGEETPLGRTRRARRINRTLAQCYPDAHAELDFRNAFELLVATVLSAQTTDRRVNSVTPRLFAAYPGPEELAAADPEVIAGIIRPTGFYRAKATNIVNLARRLVAEFDAQVPDSLEDLVSLPGVGRKTAHVVRGNAFGKPGLTVDTHFGRLCRRLRLSGHSDPVKVERDLAELIEPAEWTMFSHRMIFHGRRVCHARRPACGACPIAYDCPAFGLEGPIEPEAAAQLVTGEERGRILSLAGLEQGAHGLVDSGEQVVR